MKIVVLDGYTLNPGDLSWEKLESLGEVTIYNRTPADQILSRIENASILFTNKTPLSAETLKANPQVKFIGVLATGYNVVDVAAAADLGITVTNVPIYGTTAVAQMTFALLLEICHHAWAHNIAVKDGEWTNNQDWSFWKYPLVELADKTMGIIGFGRIGRAVSAIARAFGMRVLAYDAFPINEPGDGVSPATLATLFAESDVISLHCPLFDSTAGLINSANIEKMKDGVFIINTSRGGLVVEEDMRKALENGKVGAFAADVVSTEPIKQDNPLINAPNTILTPHIAWAPKESRARLMDTAVENLRLFISGTPENVVKASF
ncbi:MAG: D-2-hydroxyacid dehydrogenase [Spirochaetales bacterium]|jgi:glycerate dehydrogenase|nr:D-2-hydroxyacid dehydrogenase [Spirochaetales bacterium]